jgi:4-amino-4-deoxy-L-arabinose transferase-like glycosyltransferase
MIPLFKMGTWAKNEPQTYRNLLWIGFAAFAVRVAVRCYSGAEDFWVNGYGFFFELAQNIAAGNGIFAEGPLTAFRVPLYPAFLAAVTFGQKAFLPIVLAQAVIGVGTVWCTALLAREMFGSAAAIIAATITALYPYYVVHDTALQETSLYTFLAALAVLLLMRARRSGSSVMSGWAGLTLGAAVLTRANIAPFALLAPLWLTVPGQCRMAPWSQRWRIALVCAGVLALTVSPWLVRSFLLTGSVTLSTQTGFFLWLGNNPYTFSRYPQESIDHSQAVALVALNSQEKSELEARQHNEAMIDEWFWKKGLNYIHDRPWRTVGNGLRKIVDAFGWLPSPRRSFWPSLAHALSYGPVMIFGLWGMWASRRHWREHSIFYAQFVAFVAVTAVFFGHTSYRAYLDVYWIVFAAVVLATWLHRSPYRRLLKPAWQRAPYEAAPLQSFTSFDADKGYPSGQTPANVGRS